MLVEMMDSKNILVKLTVLALSILPSVANACFFDREYPGARGLSKVSSIFIADVLDYQIYFGGEMPYFASLKIDNIEPIMGEKASELHAYYLIEDNNEDITDFLGEGRYIIAIEKEPPMYVKRKEGNNVALPLKPNEPNAKWIVNRACFLPFIIEYSPRRLEFVLNSIEKDLKKQAGKSN